MKSTNNSIEQYVDESKFVKDLYLNGIKGNIFSGSKFERLQSWSFWGRSNIVLYNSNERSYTGLKLPGSFYNANDKITLKPHIELSSRILSDYSNSSVLISHMGNQLVNKYWVYSEIKAIRNSINSLSDNISLEKIDEFYNFYNDIMTKSIKIKNNLKPIWDQVTDLIMSCEYEDTLNILSDFNLKKNQSGFSFDLSIKFNKKLLESDKEYALRRVGIWNVFFDGINSLTVLTPRLTSNSQIYYDEKNDSIISVYINYLLLNRIFSILSKKGFDLNYKLEKKGYISKKPAKFGKTIPKATVDTLYNFITDFDHDEAWDMILKVIGEKESLLSDEKIYKNNYNIIKNKVSKLENITQEEVNILLPLIINSNGEMFRVIYNKR